MASFCLRSMKGEEHRGHALLASIQFYMLSEYISVYFLFPSPGFSLHQTTFSFISVVLKLSCTQSLSWLMHHLFLLFSSVLDSPHTLSLAVLHSPFVFLLVFFFYPVSSLDSARAPRPQLFSVYPVPTITLCCVTLHNNVKKINKAKKATQENAKIYIYI